MTNTNTHKPQKARPKLPRLSLRMFREISSINEKTSYQRAIKLMKRDGLLYGHLSKELRLCREIALAAMESDGRALQFAGSRQRNDLKIVLKAIKTYPESWIFASPRLRRSKKFREMIRKYF